MERMAQLELRKKLLDLLKEDEELRYAVAGLLGLEDLRASAKRLEDAVARLAEAQARAEEQLSGVESRLTRLEDAVAKLAEAQVRAEERLSAVESRLTRLEDTVARLAEAQVRAEERLTRLENTVARLAEAQARTEERVARLEDAVAKLVEGLNILRSEVGRLSEAVGFGLEDIARALLPGWLHKHLGVEVEDLRREFLLVGGEEVEVDLYGEGSLRGERVVVLGEVKSRIYDTDVERFYRRIYRPASEALAQKTVGVLFGYLIHPSAKKKAQDLGLYVVASYER
ncbi:hypothetical protein IG193_01390 [Infirmifilum lucidum]|uniref:DUF8196 domain-containing protein n=1 Tax=Infirmifilum lucidum TaxID=2776706 RepID=A0A7L9FJN5_9CREN|nr:hypothetical protein [Infirmifilum lucidum]QOJ79144.1 hypothetical protein IG193_01390 [Infirmifilum lucidum]